MVGVHTPEFRFEADAGNVGGAVRDLGITYPVVLDPDFATWDAFGTRYWPTTYLIDRRGHVRDLHVGEGDEARTEAHRPPALAVPADSPAAPPAAQGAPGFAGDPDPRDIRRGPAHPAPDTGADRGPGRLGALRGPVAAGPRPHGLRRRLAGGRRGRPRRATAPPSSCASARRASTWCSTATATAPRWGACWLDGRPPAAGTSAGADVGAGGRLVVEGPRLYRLLQLPRERTGRHPGEPRPGDARLRVHVRLIRSQSTSSIRSRSRQAPPSSRHAASSVPTGRNPTFP